MRNHNKSNMYWLRSLLPSWSRGVAFILSLALPLMVIPGLSFAQDAQNEEVVELEEFQVEGFREGLAKAMQEQRVATNIKDIISSDSVGKLPDDNVAEAIMRLPSLYLSTDQGEGRYVSIRGVAPILNNVTMNGQTIATSDTDGRMGRAAPLDVLSAASVSAVEVIKTTTPDMDGQSIGGTVNIRTRSAFDFEGTYTSGSVEYGYNDFCPKCDNYAFEAFYATRLGEEKQWGVTVGVNYSFKDYMSHLFEGQDYISVGPGGTASGEYRAYDPNYDGSGGMTAYPTPLWDSNGDPVMDVGGMQVLGAPTSRPTLLDAAGDPVWTYEAVWDVDTGLVSVEQTDAAAPTWGTNPDSQINPFGTIVLPEGVAIGSAEGQRERKGIDGQIEFRNESTHAWLRYYFTDYLDVERRPENRFRMRDQDDDGRFRMISPTVGYGTRMRQEWETRYERQERPVSQIVIGGEHKLTDSWTVDGNFNVTEAKEDNPFLWYMESKSQECENRRNDFGPIPENACWMIDISDPQWPKVTLLQGLNAEYDGRGWKRWEEGEGGRGLAFEDHTRVRNEVSTVQEDTWTADINFKWEGELAGYPTWIKFGGKTLDRDKMVDDGSFRYNYIGPLKLYDDPGGDGSNGTLGIKHELFGEQLGAYSLGGPWNSHYQAYLGPTANIEAYVNEFNTFIGPGPSQNFNPVTYDAATSPDPNDFIIRPDLYSFDVGGSGGNSVEDDYIVNEKVSAAYAMMSMDVSETLNIMVGARIEWTDSSLGAYNQGSNPYDLDAGFDIYFVEVPVKYDNVMPNVQFRWEASDNILVRGSYTTNIARPDYPDMSPIGNFSIGRAEIEDPDDPGSFVQQDFFGGGLEQGNPGLDPYESQNFDLSAAYYFGGGTSMFSVGWFKKKIDNAIYGYDFSYTDSVSSDDLDIGEPVTRGTVTDTFGDTHEVVNFRGLNFTDLGVSTNNNAEKGEIEGLELAYQQNFDFLPEPFDGFGVVLNATFISSFVNVFQRPGEQLPFFNQPGWIQNAQLYYQKYGFEARLAWRAQGEALGAGSQPEVSGSYISDVYEAEREMLDAKISYRINDNFSIFASAKNLKNEPARTRSGGSSGIAGDNPGFEPFGTTYVVGLTWNFGE